MSNEALYISLDPEKYKINKSNILNSQVDLLRILKNTYHLKVLRNQKRDLKLKLINLVSGVASSVEDLQKEIPSSVEHEILKKEGTIEELPEIKKKVVKPKKETGHLDNELLKIQEKLRELNS